MKKYAFVLVAVSVFAVFASIVVAQHLVSPWMAHQDSSSVTTQIFVYNAENTQQTCTFTMRKVLEPATQTTGSVVIPAKTTKVIPWANYCGFITSGYPNDELPADGKFATLEISNANASFIGFTFRFGFSDGEFNVFYSEPLLAWPMFVESGTGGYN
ncbi:hypothetical protein JXQ70_03560 [bacterium]|nr:hypothetical protein [bacterium]